MSGHSRTHPERTRLAVHRTAATILVVALALVRLAFARRSVLAAVAAAIACLLSLAALTTAALLPVGDDRVPFPWAATISAAAVALLGLAGVGLTVAA